MKREFGKILIVRLSSLGDIVLTTPVINALKAKFPEAEIHYLTKIQYRDLLKTDLRISTLVEFDPHGKHKGISGLLRLASELRSQKFDLLIDLHSNLRSFLIRHLIKSRIKLEYNKRWLSRFLMVHSKFLKTRSIHTVDLYLDVLRKLKISYSDRKPEIFPFSENMKFAKNFLLERNVKKGDIVIAVHPGARWETKRWDEEKFGEVVHSLIEELKAKVILLGDEREEWIIRKIESKSPTGSTMEAIGLSLGRLASLIAHCDCLVSNDSGPMHLASALRVPVVAIFGPTHPQLGFAPLGSENVVLCANVECCPCSLHGKKRCRKKTRICMDLIEPDMVARAVEQLIKKSEADFREI